MKKAFVFDLDGTLLNSEKKITKRVINNLHYLNDSLHEIVFASARPPRFVKPLSDIFPFKTHIISYNGAMYKTDSGDIVTFFIPQETVTQILDFLDKQDPECIVSTEYNDYWITNNDFDFRTFFNEEFGPQIVSKEVLKLTPCTKILINNCSVSEQLKIKFSKLCNIIVTDNGTLIQIMNLTASKENAVKNLMNNMGVSLENVTCFGDDHNDIGLFRSCGTSVAMENSIPELKEIATFITASNDDEGISLFIENRVKKIPTI